MPLAPGTEPQLCSQGTEATCPAAAQATGSGVSVGSRPHTFELLDFV